MLVFNSVVKLGVLCIQKKLREPINCICECESNYFVVGINVLDEVKTELNRYDLFF